MSAYFAMRVKDKYEEGGIELAHAYYNQFFSIELYKQFQEGTDAILIADGLGYLIPTKN